MKIEIGESLIYSWLRHCYNCQICQTNWKTSQKWNVDEDDWNECQLLMDESSAIFENIFKQTKNIKQLMKQCEIDVLGVNTYNSSVFAVDIAYHSGGLGYKDSIDVVTKKILRTVFALKLYFPKIGTYNIYFVSPIVNKKLNDKLHIRVAEIVRFLEKNNINFNVELLSNDKFKNDILNPIMKISNDIADMSELFLRSHQLISLFENQNEVLQPSLITKSKKDSDLDGELAIGAFAQSQFRLLIMNDMLSNDMLDKLENLEYCRSILGMNFPILRKLSDKMNVKEARKINGYDRYYATPINNYLLCNDWYEKHRDTLKQWLLSFNK